MSAAPRTLDWKDGQPWSARFDDRYFSAESGIDETRHVFLQGNALAERFAALRSAQVFRVGETGFGSGLNFLCAWQLFEGVAAPGATLRFHSIERFPLDANELRAALALWPPLRTAAQAVAAGRRVRPGGRQRLAFAGGRVQLALDIGDVATALPLWPPRRIDAWFFDGFAPARNAEMWSEPVLRAAARAARPGATFATYTSAGWVRRGLQRAGFEVQRVPGFGRKREMLIGRRGSPGAAPG